MAAQKIKILSKRTVVDLFWLPFRHKTRLHCAERKAKVYGEWAMRHLYYLYVFIVFLFTTTLILSTWHDFFIHFEKLSLENSGLIKKITLITVKLSLTTTIKRENLGLVWDKPVPDRWLCFCPNFLLFCWSSMDAFGEFTSQKLVTNQLFGLAFCAARQDTFYPHKGYEQVNFYKKSSLYFIGWSFRN